MTKNKSQASRSLIGGDLIVVIFFQSNSEAGEVCVSPATLGHLNKIGEELMKVEVDLYDKGKISPLLILILI